MKQQLISILKTNAAITFAWLAFILGWLLIILAFFMPPLAIIDNSVLWVFGQALLFVSAVLGINYSFENKLDHLKHEMHQNFVRNNMADYYDNDDVMQDTEDDRDSKDI